MRGHNGNGNHRHGHHNEAGNNVMGESGIAARARACKRNCGHGERELPQNSDNGAAQKAKLPQNSAGIPAGNAALPHNSDRALTAPARPPAAAWPIGPDSLEADCDRARQTSKAVREERLAS